MNQNRLYGFVWGGTQAFKVEVPESDKKIITDSYMQRYDREPTSKEIQEIYNARVYNQLYNKAKKMQSDKNAAAGPTSTMTP